ncbi:ribosome maturation factor RimP [Sphaerotilus hippei]|uniref:Ribosome maturation factor RimP n=1 Tax=Sphaerotilus hippei TaxID=744406 RepID=A0A318H6R4_9BURK|nr:ribosome maturation factor RimP [Sphaerotilus hippei]PXW98138.1 ribosome maturation factor RimP [Sphaerotilus hippei]
MSWQQAVEKTVTGMGYELVDCGRSPGGLLGVFIDRVPERVYPSGPGEFITVDDCELVTRQLQLVLEVANVDYGRLEVSSPGLDRPLRKAADFRRFAGSEIDLTLKVVFQGRKKYRGLLRLAEPAADSEAAPQADSFELVFQDGKEDKVLGFTIEEIREARLVPLVDFKKKRKNAGEDAADKTQESGGHEE